ALAACLGVTCTGPYDGPPRATSTGGPATGPVTSAPETTAPVGTGRTTAPSPTPSPVDPGTLPQTNALPSATTRAFRRHMAALWRGIVHDSVRAAKPAFFPK